MRQLRIVALLLTVAVALPACSGFSADARRQRAYRKYIRKSSAAQQKQRAKVRQTQQQIPVEADRTETSTSTEAVPSES